MRTESEAVSKSDATAIVFCALLAFAALALVFALYMKKKAGSDDTSDKTDYFLSARNSFSACSLAWSFFASGMGAWILYTVPEVGASFGIWGTFGYAMSCVLPLVVLAAIGPYMRRTIPTGVSFMEYLELRFGGWVQIYVAFISIF